MVEDEECEIGAIELLTEQERRQVLEEWNNTSREVAKGTLAELFERQAEQTPEAVAIRQGEMALSYRELNERANRLAHYLRAQGVGTESRVAIALERGIDMALCQLATVKAGAGYLPLDSACPLARLQVMVEDARPVLLLVRSGEEGRWAALGGDLPVIDLDQQEKPWERMPSIALRPRGSRESLAYIIYTSGSTGEPRGVMVGQGAVADLVLNTDYLQLGSSDVVGHVSNTAFDAATWEIWGALLTGASLVCIDPEEVLSPRRLSKTLQSAGVTALFLTTALFNQVASEAPESFAGLDSLLFGGEQVNPERVREVLLRGRPRRLLHVYGPTETTTYASWFEVETVSEGGSVPIGRPLANTRIYILDERGEPAPVGVVGEIYIGGTGVAWGYLNRGELTAERFVVDRYAKAAGARMYRTGDLGRWRGDGTIEFCGRNDFQVKVRGYRIELGEIEARLREVSGVGEAVVVACAEESGEKRLVAYYTCEGYREEYAEEYGEKYAVEEVSAEGLRAELAGVLPEYMVPSAYVRLEQLPMTPSGKLDRRGLPAPDAAAYAGARYEEPQGETEQALAAIWTELLKVERISRHDNFFNLGGHSLLAVRVVNAVRARFDGVIAVRDVFAHPVLHELADRIVMARLRRFDPADLIKVLGTCTID
jgi:amino acid adenylation domain-containing protein